jgi:hypothetical protein
MHSPAHQPSVDDFALRTPLAASHRLEPATPVYSERRLQNKHSAYSIKIHLFAWLKKLVCTAMPPMRQAKRAIAAHARPCTLDDD